MHGDYRYSRYSNLVPWCWKHRVRMVGFLCRRCDPIPDAALIPHAANYAGVLDSSDCSLQQALAKMQAFGYLNAANAQNAPPFSYSSVIAMEGNYLGFLGLRGIL